MWTTPRQTYPAPSPNEESGNLAELTPLTGYEPKLLDDFHYSETTEIIFRDESSDKDAVPSHLFDAELDDETIGKALSPLFIQEREEPADRRQAYHSYGESLLPAQSFSVCHSRRVRPVHELSLPCSCPQYLCLFHIVFERSPSIHDQGKMLVFPNQLLC